MRLSSISSSSPGTLYRWTLAGVLIPGWIVLAICWALLWRSGETDVDAAAKAQVASKGVANLLSAPFYPYKRAMYEAIRPDVTVLGTSRSMHFREFMFRASFYSMGGGAGTIDYAFSIADDLLFRIPPKLLVLAIDIPMFWADRELYKEQARRPHRLPVEGTPINPLVLPLKLFLDGRLTVAQVWRILSGNTADAVPTFGLYAKIGGAAFAADGSALHVHVLANRLLWPAADRFKEVLAGIGVPGATLLPGRGAAVDRRQIALLRAFIDESAAHGTVVVPVLVPFPPMVMAAVKASPAYGYMRNARQELQREIPEIIDLLDPQSIDSPDCEFYDGSHGGDITSARMVLKIAERRPELARYIATDRIKSVLQKYRGYVTAPIAGIDLAYAGAIEEYFQKTQCRP